MDGLKTSVARQSASHRLLVFIAVSTAFLLALVALGARAALAADSSLIDVLGESHDGVVASLTAGLAPLTTTLQVRSTYTVAADLDVAVVRMTDGAGDDVALPSVEADPTRLLPDPIIPLDLTLRLPEDLEPGVYTIELALTAVGDDGVVSVETTKVTVGVPAPVLEILDQGLVAEFRRSDEASRLIFHLRVSDANAENLQVILSDIKTGESGSAPVDVDFTGGWTPRRIEETEVATVTLDLLPGELPAPGVYVGNLSVSADHATPVSKPVTFIVPQAEIDVNPPTLELRRCWPDWNGGSDDLWRRWFFGLLGCGGLQEGLTLHVLADEAGSVDVSLQSSTLRDNAGRHLAPLVFPGACGGEPECAVGLLPAAPREVAINLQLPRPGAGTYSGVVHLKSPDIDSAKEIAVTAKVRHQLLYPAVVILAGVVTGWALLRAKDPENNPRLIRVKLLDLREWWVVTDVPESLREQALTIIAQAIDVDLRYGRVSEAKSKLRNVERIKQERERLRAEIDQLAKLINDEHRPGLEHLRAARKYLAAGRLSAAAQSVIVAREHRDRAAELLRRLDGLAAELREHAPPGSPCRGDSRIRLVEARIATLQTRINYQVSFDDNAAAAALDELLDAYRLYGEHKADVTYHPPKGMKHPELYAAFMRAVRSAGVDPASVLERIGRFGERPESVQLLQSALPQLQTDLLTRLLGSQDLEEIQRTVRQQEFYVEMHAAAQPPIVGEPVRFDVRERVPHFYDRRVASDWNVRWETTPSGAEITPKGSEATICFPEAVSYTVGALLEPTGEQLEHTCTPAQVTIGAPHFQIQVDPSSGMRAKERISFAVLVSRKGGGAAVEVDPDFYTCTGWTKIAVETKRPPTIVQRAARTWRGFVGCLRRLCAWFWRTFVVDEDPYSDGHSSQTTGWSSLRVCDEALDFPTMGSYTVSVSVTDKNGKPYPQHPISPLSVDIEPSALVQEARTYHRQQIRAFWVSLGIAVLGGMLAISAFAETFGSLREYLGAFLWGTGVNVAANGAITGWQGLVNRVSKLWKPA